MYNAVKVSPETFPDLIQDIANSGDAIGWFADMFIRSLKKTTVFYLVQNYVETERILESEESYTVITDNPEEVVRPWYLISEGVLKNNPNEFVISDKL